MQTNYPSKRKSLALPLTIGLALTITGWTLAHTTKPTTPFSSLASQSTAKPADSKDPLVKKVIAALAKQSKLKGEKIQVESASEGKVRLTGSTSHQTKRSLAIETAEKVAGKGNVISELVSSCGNQVCNENCCCSMDRNNVLQCQCQPQACPTPKPKSKKAD
ncbi:MAG: BON domain-containing protein [Acidobacteria bacterium]|nr:BON domain-containing protein [Acidobacteriota bacterium]